MGRMTSVKGQRRYVGIIRYWFVPNDPMLLFLDNSDSPSIVEQQSQGPGSACNTFY